MTTVTFGTSFGIVGVSCGHCQHAITEAVAPLPGIITVAVDYISGTASVGSRTLLDLLHPNFEVAP